MSKDRISDPVLGDEGWLWITDESEEGTFLTEFGPTQSQVSILVDVANRSVPVSQHDLYRQIEAWYPRGVHEITAAIRQIVEKNQVLQQDLPLDQMSAMLRLIAIDIRARLFRPVKCVLRYRYDTNAPDWYVVISEDFQVEACGLLD